MQILGVILGILGIVSGLFLVGFSENLVIRMLGGKPFELKGLNQSLHWVLSQIREEGGPLRSPPQVYRIESPAIEIYSARSYWSSGSILVSSGWVAHQGEEEIRAALKGALVELSSRASHWRTFRLALGILTIRWVPSEWLEFGGCLGLPDFSYSKFFQTRFRSQLLKPGSMVIFLLWYPFLKWLLSPFADSTGSHRNPYSLSIL